MKFYYLFLLIFFINFCKKKEIQNLQLDFVSYKKYIITIHYTKTEKPNGTGLLINQNTILTCEHIIKNWENSIFIDYEEQKKFYPAKVIAKDEKKDLALLSVDKAIVFFPEKISYKKEIQVGEEVFTFGSMYGFPYSFLKGYISYPLRKEVDYTRMPHIHIIGLAYSGVSGAPVFTYDGKFIGIVRGVFGFGLENGNSMIIPVETILEFLKKNNLELE